MENVRLAGWVNNKPAVILDIQRQPGANIIETADRVKALLPKLARLTAAVGESCTFSPTARKPSAPPCATCNSRCCSRWRWW